MNNLEREEQYLEEEYENGGITMKEYNKLLSELRREYRGAAEESAQGAYDDELNRW